MSDQLAQGTGTDLVKRGMAQMLKGGVIMDVVNAEQAKIAQDAGAVPVWLCGFFLSWRLPW